MRLKSLVSLCFVLLATSAGYCSPPVVPKEIKVKPSQLVRIPVKTDVEIGFTRNFTDDEAFFGELVSPKGTRQFVFQAQVDDKGNPLKSQYVIGWWVKGETEGVTTTLVAGTPTPIVPVPPDVPPGPPNPPIPPVDPLKTFRVIFIYESADTITPDVRAVVYGKAVEDWMNANCTGGKAGWRRRDKDAPGDTDPTMSALWNAVKPAVTVTPSVAIERNGKVEIINIEATPAKMIETLTKYRGK